MFKGRRRHQGIAVRKIKVSFGNYGMKALGHAWVTARQIEAVRRTITREIQKGGKVWIRIFPDKPITKKAAEVPMGGGKGSVDHYVAVVKPGMILFEVGGVSREIAEKAFDLAAYKLPVKTKFVSKD